MKSSKYLPLIMLLSIFIININTSLFGLALQTKLGAEVKSTQEMEQEKNQEEYERLIEQGLKSFMDKNYYESLKLLSKALGMGIKEDPGILFFASSSANLFAKQKLYNDGDRDLANLFYSKALIFIIASIEIEIKNSNLQLLTKLYYLESEINYELYKLTKEPKYFKDCKASLDNCLKYDSGDSSFYAKIGYSYLLIAEFGDEPINCFNRMFRNEDMDFPQINSLIDKISRSIEGNPKNFELYYFRAYIFKLIFMKTKDKKYFKKSLDDFIAYIKAFCSLYETRCTPDIVRELKKYGKGLIRNGEIQTDKLKLSSIKMKLRSKGNDIYEKTGRNYIIDGVTKIADSFYFIADLYYLKRNYKKSLEYINKSLAINETIEGLALKGVCLVRESKEKKIEAFQCLNKALEKESEDSEISHKMGLYYSEIDDWDNAVFWLGKAVQFGSRIKRKFVPDNTYEDLISCGFVEASENFVAWIQFDKEKIRESLKKNQDIATFESTIMFKDSIFVSSELAEKYYGLAYAYYKKGDYDNALKNIRNAIHLKDNDISYRYLKAMILSSMEEYALSNQEIDLLFTEGNRTPEVCYLRATNCLCLDDLNGAEDAISGLNDSIPSEERYKLQGILFKKKGEFDIARDCFEKSLKLYRYIPKKLFSKKSRPKLIAAGILIVEDECPDYYIWNIETLNELEYKFPNNFQVQSRDNIKRIFMQYFSKKSISILYYHIAETLLCNGNIELALDNVIKAIEIDPEHTEASFLYTRISLAAQQEETMSEEERYKHAIAVVDVINEALKYNQKKAAELYYYKALALIIIAREQTSFGDVCASHIQYIQNCVLCVYDEAQECLERAFELNNGFEEAIEGYKKIVFEERNKAQSFIDLLTEEIEKREEVEKQKIRAKERIDSKKQEIVEAEKRTKEAEEARINQKRKEHLEGWGRLFRTQGKVYDTNLTKDYGRTLIDAMKTNPTIQFEAGFEDKIAAGLGLITASKNSDNWKITVSSDVHASIKNQINAFKSDCEVILSIIDAGGVEQFNFQMYEILSTMGNLSDNIINLHIYPYSKEETKEMRILTLIKEILRKINADNNNGWDDNEIMRRIFLVFHEYAKSINSKNPENIWNKLEASYEFLHQTLLQGSIPEFVIRHRKDLLDALSGYTNNQEIDIKQAFADIIQGYKDAALADRNISHNINALQTSYNATMDAA